MAEIGADLDEQPAHHAATQAERRAEEPDCADHRRTSMPAMLASAGFSLTARMARPISVRVIRRCTTMTAMPRAPASAVGRAWRAGPAKLHGDLQRIGEIGGTGGEDEFEETAQSQRCAEARHAP